MPVASRGRSTRSLKVPKLATHGPQHMSERATASAAELRGAMTDKLIADGWITSAIAETAFRAVPRELFAHDSIPLETVHNADTALRGKRGTDGTLLSVVSAPRVQARMIAQARIRPGMSVIEVGSGGYNAALLAEITGPSGRVVSVDIDPDITALAVMGLRAGPHIGIPARRLAPVGCSRRRHHRGGQGTNGAALTRLPAAGGVEVWRVCRYLAAGSRRGDGRPGGSGPGRRSMS
jgi:hypothetical protein